LNNSNLYCYSISIRSN